jgi:hypothetical protein
MSVAGNFSRESRSYHMMCLPDEGHPQQPPNSSRET